MRILMRRLSIGSRPSSQPGSSGPVWPLSVAGMNGIADKLKLVVGSIRVDTKRQRHSNAHVHADDAEGVQVR
jgi:hypothetical protein